MLRYKDQPIKQAEIVMIIFQNKIQHPNSSHFNVVHSLNDLSLSSELRSEQIPLQYYNIKQLVQRHQQFFYQAIDEDEIYTFNFDKKFFPIMMYWVANNEKIKKPTDLLESPEAKCYLLLWSLGNMLKNNQQLDSDQKYQEFISDQNPYLEFIFLLFKNIMNLEENLQKIHDEAISQNNYLILRLEYYQAIIKVQKEGQFNLYDFSILEKVLEDDLLNNDMEYNIRNQILQIEEQIKQWEMDDAFSPAILNQEKLEILKDRIAFLKQVSEALKQNKNYDFYQFIQENNLKLQDLHNLQLKRFQALLEKIIAENSDLIQSYRELAHQTDLNFKSVKTGL